MPPLPIALLLSLSASVATASNEVTEVAAAGAPVQLTPFGTLSTTLAWLVLVALNAWCFHRIVRGRPAGARQGRL